MIRSTLAFAGLTFVGFLTGVVGAAEHRYHPYWGSILVIAVVLASATFARASRSWFGLVVYASAWFLTAFLLFALHGPGDSVVILDDALGRTLFVGGALAIVAVAFLPSAWMRDPSEWSPAE
ncbi:MAG TPA: hypothetical protein VF362_03105 [Demequinaceae bacterium]